MHQACSIAQQCTHCFSQLRFSEQSTHERLCPLADMWHLHMSFLHCVFLSSTGTPPLSSHCSHFSFTWMQCWHPLIRAAQVPRGPQSTLPKNSRPSFLSSSCPVTTPPPPTDSAHLLRSRQQIWTSDTGVPATRGEAAEVIPARTFSSSLLSWQQSTRETEKHRQRK